FQNPCYRIIALAENLAFEFGVFKDVERKTQKIVGQGNYSITWILENEVWKILCHTWSMPIKDE
ncbi:MAG: hypothetical protein AAFO07_12415, partial [Bacteroidota bacterium]